MPSERGGQWGVWLAHVGKSHLTLGQILGRSWADLGVNVRIPSLTGCQYKAIYGTPWRIDPLDNRQFLCSAGHHGLQKTNSEQRGVSRDQERKREVGRNKRGAVIRSIYHTVSTHAYSDAPSTSAFIHNLYLDFSTLSECCICSERADAHRLTFLHWHTKTVACTPTRSATTNIAEMETAQERGHGQAALCYGDRGENIKRRGLHWSLFKLEERPNHSKYM